MYQNTDLATDPLVAATRDAIVEKGLAGLSSRDIAAAAGASAATINRRFGSQAELIRVTIEAGLADYRAHLDCVCGEIGNLAVAPADVPAFLHGVMSAVWCRRPDLAVMGWHVATLPTTTPASAEIRRSWQEAGGALWARTAGAAGLSAQDGEILGAALGSFARGSIVAPSAVFFEGLAWDFCRQLSHRLIPEAALGAADSKWRAALAGEALSRSFEANEDTHPSKRAIIDAAAALIIEAGPFALTHRLVAERADVSLSSTTHHFDSLGDILWEAIMVLLRSGEVRQIEESSASVKEHAEAMGHHVAKSVHTSTTRLSEVELVTRYRPELKELAGALLARHGTSSVYLLRSLKGRRDEVGRLDGVVWHHLMSALLEGAALEPESDDRQKYVAARVERWATRLFC